MKNKLTVDELTRRAFVYAEQDRLSWLDAHENCRRDPSYAEVISSTEMELKQLREYRIKRWGKGVLEQRLEEAVAVPIHVIAGRKEASDGE